MDSCGESFFFYGLTNLFLFSILAWWTWVIRVRDIFCSSSFTRSTWLLVPSTTNHVQKLTFLLFYFRWREEVPTSVSGSQPIVWLLPSSFRCQATRVRLPSINICGSPLCDLHSFLAVTLWWLATVNSNTGIVLILFLSSQWDITWHFADSMQHKAIFKTSLTGLNSEFSFSSISCHNKIKDSVLL